MKTEDDSSSANVSFLHCGGVFIARPMCDVRPRVADNVCIAQGLVAATQKACDEDPATTETIYLFYS